MGLYLNAMAATLSRPAALVAGSGLLVLWILTLARARRLAAILAHLESLPAAKRRYQLEKLHPGPKNQPVPFVRNKRRRLLAFAVSLTAIAGAAFLGSVAGEVLTARAARVVLRELAIIPSGPGYLWRVELANTGAPPVVIDELSLEILDKSSHPVSDRPRPPDPAHPGVPRVVISPQEELAGPLLDETPVLAPRAARNLSF